VSGREKEIRKVAADLDGLLDELQEAVGGLTAILTSPPDGGSDGAEVLAK
jgi:hypothetical protein